MHNPKKDTKDSATQDSLIQIHKEDCEEIIAFSEAVCHTIRVILDLIVICLPHLSIE